MLPLMLICGIDEAGRGPLAGPVAAAAVVLDIDPAELEGLTDSKKLQEADRLRLDGAIRARCRFGLGFASVEEIDTFNIRQANLLAMRRAFEVLSGLLDGAPVRVLVDGNDPPSLPCPVTAIVGGDASEPAISAASILAKVARDAVMHTLARRHPGYGFEAHKGYATAAHLEALRRLGPCAAHRRSFAPVRAMLAEGPAR